MNTKDLKYKLSPILVAEHFLGAPDRTTRFGNWYKSPFRQERTASFLVYAEADRNMYDFGSNKAYDIISFVQELFNVNFKDALSILKREFGISDEQENKQVLKYKLSRKAQEVEIRKKLSEWYNLTFQVFCDKLHLFTLLSHHCNNDLLPKLYDKQIKYEIILEDFLDVKTQDDLENLYTKYKGAK